METLRVYGQYVLQVESNFSAIGFVIIKLLINNLGINEEGAMFILTSELKKQMKEKGYLNTSFAAEQVNSRWSSIHSN